MKPLLSGLADADLNEIHLYTASNFGAMQAEYYTAQLMDRIDLVGTRPTMGQTYPNRSSPYRRVGCRSHFIYYRTYGDNILIVRILHKQMRQSQHLG